MASAGSFTELFCNGCGDLSGVRSAGARFRNDFFGFPEQFSGGYHGQSGAGGEIAAVYDMNMAQFPGCKAAVLIRTGQGMAEIDMDDLITCFHPGPEMVDILLYIDRCGLWQCFMVIILLINLFRGDVYIIKIILPVQVDVKREIVDVVTFFKLFIKITGAVCTQDDLQLCLFVLMLYYFRISVYILYLL